MIMSTVETVPGREIARTLGVVTGNVIGAHSDGGYVRMRLKKEEARREQTAMLAQRRAEAFDLLAEAARNRGADAISA